MTLEEFKASGKNGFYDPASDTFIVDEGVAESGAEVILAVDDAVAALEAFKASGQNGVYDPVRDQVFQDDEALVPLIVPLPTADTSPTIGLVEVLNEVVVAAALASADDAAAVSEAAQEDLSTTVVDTASEATDDPTDGGQAMAVDDINASSLDSDSTETVTARRKTNRS